MSIKNVKTIFALSLLLIASCAPSKKVEVVNFTPEGEIPKLTTFTVEFSENLAPADMLNTWLDDKFIEFEPGIDGRFKWIDEKTLLFSPDYALAPIQSYTAKITDEVLFNSDYTLETEQYDFFTPDFDVYRVDFFWNRVANKDYRITVQANIHFNYPVSPDMLKQYLMIESGGKEYKDFNVVSEETAELIAIDLGEIEQQDKEQELTITIKKGLQSIIGKKPLEDEREFEYDLPPITRLAITGVSSGFDGTNGWIEISTTQMVDKDKIREYVSLKPIADVDFFVNDNGFRVEGDFENLNSVDLKIEKGLPGLYGGELEFDYEQVVTLVDIEPSINFADKSGKYLMYGGQQNIEVNVVNVDEVDIDVSKVYKNNLVHFLDRYSYSYYNDYYYGYNPDYYVGNFGKPLYSKTEKIGAGRNWINKLNVNLNDALNYEYKGIFVLSVRSNERRWIQDSKMIAISDLGIIAKKSDKEITVFINSISEAAAVQNVVVTVLSSNNQVLLSGTTNEEGVVKFENVENQLDGFYPRVITAELGGDFNYIDLNLTNIETSRYDVGGITQYSEYYTAYLYGDRNLYRPGEKVSITGIIRDDKNNVIEPIPFVLKIISPTGKKFEEYNLKLNKQSSFEVSFDMPDYAQTGQYIAELITGNEQLVNTYNFSIEEFAPDKIRVALESDKEIANPGESVSVDIDAEFLFGAKAADLKYQADIQLRHQPFYSKNYPGFSFVNSSIKNSLIESIFLDGNLDAEGHSEINYIIPSNLESNGIIYGSAFVSVFDLTGRTVNRAATFKVYPKNYFTGIKKEGYYFGTDKNLNFQFIAVDSDDKQINNFAADIELVRYEWQTILKKDNSGRYYYDSERKQINVWKKSATINGVTDYTVVADRSGEYELRIYKEGEDDYYFTTFYAYSWGGATASSFQVDKEGRVDIIFDKDVYEPGDIAKVLFTAPFSGRMLITMERNGIYDYRYVTVDQRSIEIEIPVMNEYMPNVYIGATLFKKHTLDNGVPFLVGHGFESMKVEKKNNLLPVSINAPDKIKPRRKQNVTVSTAPEQNIYVTVAVVDEGILQIKNYTTPDPYSYMNAKRPLMTESYDLYKLLLPELIGDISSPAGGEGLLSELKKRTNPITTKRFKLLSYWSGIKKTDSKGNVTVELDIPQFNGEVRIMAVAYSGSRFGNAESYMKIADDIIIEPEVPRFLSLGDSLVSNVTVINTSSQEGSVSVSASVEGPLSIVSADEEKVTVKPNSTSQVQFKIATTDKIGKGKIIFETSGMASVKEEIDIGVRPVSPLITETGFGTIKAGEDLVVNIPSNFLEGTQNTSLTISKFPAVKFAEHLKYLVKYPHGCIEQTVSTLFPQLYFGEIAKLIAPELYASRNPVYYVKEGIRKLESMQLYDGSMAYWQGGTRTNWWGSVYAAHFLIEAKKAGFLVEENILQNLLKYISSEAKQKKTYDYVSYPNNRKVITKIASKEIPYSLYVMALAGLGDISTMNYYKARPHLLSNDSKYLIAGAYALMGKMNSYKEFLPKEFTAEHAGRQTGGTFDSDIRSNAIILNVLLEVDPTSNQIPLLVKYLTQNSREMYSTQERAFAFLALGKAASLNADTDMTLNIKVGDQIIGTFENKDETFTDSRLNGNEVTLAANGTGEVYYFWNTEGVKINEKVKEEDSFMRIRREYFDYRSKRKVINSRFTQGQLIVCKISLTGTERNAENIVISDLIPAGFEIENPRLSASTEFNWSVTNPMNVEYMDIRDDRLLLFTNLSSNRTTEFYYMLRVVNKGQFMLPVIAGEAMYDREFHSYNGAGKVVVK